MFNQAGLIHIIFRHSTAVGEKQRIKQWLRTQSKPQHDLASQQSHMNSWNNHKNFREQCIPWVGTWHPLAWEHQAGLPFCSWFGFLLWVSSWKSSQVLGSISQAKALGHMTQVDRFDVEDVLEASGIGSVGTKKRLQCWGEKKKSEFC